MLSSLESLYPCPARPFSPGTRPVVSKAGRKTDSHWVPDMGNDASTLMKQVDLAIENWFFTLNHWVLICFNMFGCFMRIEPPTSRKFYRNLCIESWGQNIKYGDFTSKKTEHILTKQKLLLLGWEPIFGKFIGMSRMILYGSAVMVWNPLLYIYTIVWFKCPKPFGPLDGLLDRGRVWPCLALCLCLSGVLWGRRKMFTSTLPHAAVYLQHLTAI